MIDMDEYRDHIDPYSRCIFHIKSGFSSCVAWQRLCNGLCDLPDEKEIRFKTLEIHLKYLNEVLIKLETVMGLEND